ncbi:MAG: hypothetical protein FJW64_05305 [Actinobacteria bacterium]|nr:hypothetical protein [Actinomycetota bacterium]
MTTMRTPLALIAASALLLLTGCTGGGSPSTASETSDAPSSTPTAVAETESAETTAPEGGQSKDDACQIIITSFTDVSQASSDIATSDPETAIATFKTLADKVETDFAQITNAEVAPLAQEASTQLQEYVTFLDGVLADPNNASGLGDQITALQDSFTQAGTACQG